MTTKPKKTIKDFDEDERWQAFAEEYVANGGVMTFACEKAGLHKDTASRMKKHNPEFIKWLDEIVDADDDWSPAVERAMGEDL